MGTAHGESVCRGRAAEKFGLIFQPMAMIRQGIYDDWVELAVLESTLHCLMLTVLKRESTLIPRLVCKGHC